VEVLGKNCHAQIYEAFNSHRFTDAITGLMEDKVRRPFVFSHRSTSPKKSDYGHTKLLTSGLRRSKVTLRCCVLKSCWKIYEKNVRSAYIHLMIGPEFLIAPLSIQAQTSTARHDDEYNLALAISLSEAEYAQMNDAHLDGIPEELLRATEDPVQSISNSDPVNNSGLLTPFVSDSEDALQEEEFDESSRLDLPEAVSTPGSTPMRISTRSDTPNEPPTSGTKAKRSRRSKSPVPELEREPALVPVDVKWVRAKFSFKGRESGDLVFQKNDIIEVHGAVYKAWWKGTLRGATGIFPINYVETLDEEQVAPIEEKDGDECCVCFEVGSDFCLIPCGHSGYCESCAKKFTVCPFCKANVSKAMRLFKP
jgi:Zinc finger, C3HC4 type (RING finger)/SH3 domain